jgi:hypothetical protein
MPDGLLLCVSFGDEVAPFSADKPVHEVAELMAFTHMSARFDDD